MRDTSVSRECSGEKKGVKVADAELDKLTVTGVKFAT